MRLLAFVVAAFVGLLAVPVLAQGLDTGINAVGPAIGLSGGGDPRILIARIIRFFLGFLGIVAVILVLYGGFLWMTAAGNEDRVSQARSVLINAGIGLVIILSAFAIVSYILSTFITATTEQICQAGDPSIACLVVGCGGEQVCSDTNGDGVYTYGGCTPFPGCVPGGPNAFVIGSFSPPNGKDDAPRNAIVRVRFNEAVEADTLTYGSTTDSVRVYPASDPSAVLAGTLDVSNVTNTNQRSFTFTPDAHCDAPNDTLSCFASTIAYTVEITGGTIRSASGRALNCTYPSNPCKVTFTTGDYIDTVPPHVSITEPWSNQVPADSIVNVRARATDDHGVSSLIFSNQTTGAALGTVGVLAAPYTLFSGGVAWSTNGLVAGTQQTLVVHAFDFVDGHDGVDEKTVTIRPPFCFDGRLSGDETGPDCGGSCGACPGESCDSNITAPSCQADPFGCSVTSACSSESCLCASPPVITAVTPNDGAPGNYTTITGSGFGTTPGTVTFLGTDKDGDNNAADDPAIATDDVVATLPAVCSAAATWKDTQIIIEVPTDAVDGPLEVSVPVPSVNTEGTEVVVSLTDRTDTAPGPVLPSFNVNTTIRPGLCEITPAAACVNDPDISSVSFSGKNFGGSKGTILFGTTSAVVSTWTPTEVISSVANVRSGSVGARVKTVAGDTSNPFNFTVNSCVAGPRIDKISPDDGPAGQAITITGDNFSNSTGEVHFVSANGEDMLAAISSPAACSARSLWHNNQIITKVPSALTFSGTASEDNVYGVYVKRQDLAESNRDVLFTLTNTAATPGLYCVVPDNGPATTSVMFYGESFGEPRGANDQVRFSDGKNNPKIGANATIASGKWKNQSIETSVSDEAVSGATNVVKNDQTNDEVKSNPLNFTVQSCLDSGNSCGEGLQCCGDGTCLEASETCPVAPALQLASYRWRFSTGNPVPRVVEEQQCNSSTQSPSPWKGSADACTNAQLSVRFTTPLDQSSIPSTALEVADCGTDPSCKNPTTPMPASSLQFFTYTNAAGVENGGFTADAGGFVLNHWYQARVTTTVVSDKGVPMANDYTWQFKTGSDTCAIAALSCQPAFSTLTTVTSRGNLAASLQAKNCNILTCPSGSVKWSSADSTVTTIDSALTGCYNTASPISEGETTVTPRSVKDPSARTSQCTVKVAFEAPKVIEPFPSCTAACKNADVGAVFSRSLNASTLDANKSVRLYRCEDQNCNPGTSGSGLAVVTVADPIYTVVPATATTTERSEITFAPADGLLSGNTYYRVVLTNAILSEEGKPLTANYQATILDTELRGYSWVFKTKDAVCSLNRIETIPAAMTMRTIGATQNVVVQPYGSPDECNAYGQRLTAASFAYGWQSNNTDVGTVTTRDVLPHLDADGHLVASGFVDPLQTATAVGKDQSCSAAPNYQCSTAIGASIDLCTIDDNDDGTADTCNNQQKSCTSDSDCATITTSTLTLQCGFTPPQLCVATEQSVIANGSFELSQAGGNDSITGWTDATGDNTTSSEFLRVGDGADIRQYYRQPDCGSADCSFAEGLVQYISLPYPVSNQAYDVSFAARRLSSFVGSSRVRVYLAEANQVSEKISNAYFDGDSSVHPTANWLTYDGTVTLPSTYEGKAFLLVFELPTGTDLDAVSLVPHVCSKQTSRACSTTAQCNSDPSHTANNLCGGGTAVGQCDDNSLTCTNDRQVSCADSNGNANDNFCSFAVNSGGCCGIRPWVTAIDGAKSPADGKICRNAAFTVSFSTLMDQDSVAKNINLDWLDTVGDCDVQANIDAVNHTSVIGDFFRFVRRFVFNEAGATAANTWCTVSGTSVVVRNSDENNGLTPQTNAILSVPDLLHHELKYRVVVHGPTAINPTGGAKSIYGVSIADDVAQGFPMPPQPGLAAEPGVGDHVCAVDKIEVNVVPELSKFMAASQPRTLLKPYDVFSCFGNSCNCEDTDSGIKLGCRLTNTGEVSEDQDSLKPKNQHRYDATAVDALGQQLSANYLWQAEDPEGLLSLAGTNQQELETTLETKPKDTRSSRAFVTVSADLGGVPETSGSNAVPVTVSLCQLPWSNGPLQDGPADTDTNFFTTYCRDNAPKTKGRQLYCSNDGSISCSTNADCSSVSAGTCSALPNFLATNVHPSVPNPLGVLNEWILKDPSSIDAIGVRVVKNSRHLTPAAWYAEQPFQKGSPQSVTIDGYPAIRDGRTVYINAANAVVASSTNALFTNIYIFSYNQGAGATTLNVYNQLLNNLVFNINRLNTGSCQSVQTGEPEASEKKTCSNDGKVCQTNDDCDANNSCDSVAKTCLFTNDCSSGYVCTNTKSKITRDVTRLGDTIETTSALAGYRYGTSCPAVTPGAPGDANCNGVIDGNDIALAEQYRQGLIDRPSYCQAADYDGDGDVDGTDVSNIITIVRSSCQRAGGRSTNYPPLTAGTYVSSTSTSRWPSWVATLGNTLGRQLPTDPLNRFATCEAGGSLVGGAFEATTCWDPQSKTYASHNATLDATANRITHVVPPPDVSWARNVTYPGSHVYTYSAYGRCSVTSTTACFIDSDCPEDEQCQGQGQDYAVCSFPESSYRPNPALLNQVATDGRFCVVTDPAVARALPGAPGSGSDDTGTIFPSDFGLKPLTITLFGSGAGSIRVSLSGGPTSTDTCTKPLGITVRCEFAYDANTAVRLTAVPAGSDSSVGAWGGNCVGATTYCDRVMDAQKTVTQNFVIGTVLTVSSAASVGDATAVATANGTSQSCASTADGCSFTFDKNTVVSVALYPKTGTTFSGWEGSCPGTESGTRCTNIIMSQSVDLTPGLVAASPFVSVDLPTGSTYVAGQQIAVHWTTTNATTISLTSDGNTGDQINRTGLGTSGTENVTAKVGMTKFTLTATGPGGTVSQDVSFVVNQATAINSFSASASSIILGDTVTLSWSVSGSPTALALQVDGNTFANPAVSATTATDTPESVGTKTYTLIASGLGGTVQSTVTVEVTNPAPTVMDSFTASPSTVEVNKPVTLTWSLSGTAPDSLALQVNNATFANPAVSATTATHTPTTTGTKTYKLITTGPGGTTEKTATVTVVNQPSISNFQVKGPGGAYGASAEVGTGDTITFTWTTANATSASIDQGVGDVGSVVSGTKTFIVTSATTQTIDFTLTATGSVSSAIAPVSVKVHRAPAIELSALDASNATGETSLTVDGEGPVTLAWTGDTEFGSITSFIPNPGSYANSSFGSVNISPASPSSTTYTITVRGKFGTTAASTASDSVTVIVRSTIGVAFAAGSGSGSVTATSTRPSKTCTANCSYYPNTGDTVTLAATANANSRFIGWTDCPSGATSPCTFTVGDSQTITANFAKAYTLTLEKRDAVSTTTSTTNGTVGVGIVVPISGGEKPITKNLVDTGFVEKYTDGTMVGLSALDGTNAIFDHWSDPSCGNSANCQFTVSSDKTLYAYFLRKPDKPTFTISPAGCTTSNPCSPTQGFVFTWTSVAGQTYQLNPGAINVTGGRWPSSGTKQLPGSATFTLTATNAAGSTISDPKDVWLRWSSQLLADGTSSSGNITPIQVRHDEASPRVIVANDQDGNPANDVAYVFFSGEGNGGTCRFLRGTIVSNAFTFAPADEVARNCRHIAVWYDKWTPNVAGDVAHIAVTKPGGSKNEKDRINYYTMSGISTTAPSAIWQKVTNTASPLQELSDTEKVSVTERTTGDGLFTLGQSGGSYIDQCTLNNGNACTRLVNPYDNNEDEATQLVPLASEDSLGSVLLFHQNQAATALYAERWQGSAKQRVLVDSAATIDPYYQGAFSAVTNPVTGDTYVVYKSDGGTVGGGDDEIRMKERNKSQLNFSTRENPVKQTAGEFGIHDVALALDTQSGYLYVAYAVRTSSLSTSSVVRYVRSVLSTNDSSWRSAQGYPSIWTNPVTVISEQGEYRGISLNYLSQGRLYVTAVDTTRGAVKLRGATVNVLAPPQ